MSASYGCPNCGDDCWHSQDGVDGYPWCRPCMEHHRPPECAVDAAGRSLQWCGCPWENDDGSDAPHTCETYAEPVSGPGAAQREGDLNP